MLKENRKRIIIKEKSLRISPSKLQTYLNKLKGLQIYNLSFFLYYSNTKIANILNDILRKFRNNIVINHRKFHFDKLIVREAYVNKSIILKRSMPRAKGRIYEIKKRVSHFTIVIY